MIKRKIFLFLCILGSIFKDVIKLFYDILGIDKILHSFLRLLWKLESQDSNFLMIFFLLYFSTINFNCEREKKVYFYASFH